MDKRLTGLEIIALAMLMLYILSGIAITPLHGDETTLIYMGRDFYYQFVQGDWERVLYNENPDSVSPTGATEQHLRLLNGTIPKYLFGYAAYSLGYAIDNINGQWDWGADWAYNQANGNIPPDDLLWRARFFSALMLAGGLLVIYAIAKYLGGRVVASIAILAYALNPALLLHGRRAMMEGGMVFFSLLALLAGLWLVQHRTWWTFVLLGLFSGMAVATKHTAVFTVMAIFAAIGSLFLIRALRDRNRHYWKHFGWLVMAGILALALFYLLNPAWWGDPFSRVGDVLESRTKLLEGQIQTFGGYNDFVGQLGGFMRQTFMPSAQYYEVESWAAPLADQITNYENTLYDGLAIGGSLPGLLLTIVVSIWGFRALLQLSIDKRWLIGGWALTILLTTLLLTPLEWQRYYVPAYPVIALLAGLGTQQLIDLIQKRR